MLLQRCGRLEGYLRSISACRDLGQRRFQAAIAPAIHFQQHSYHGLGRFKKESVFSLGNGVVIRVG